MDEVFYWLFNMSIAASAAGVFVLLLRIIKKIPRRVVVILWAIPFLRMWVPVGIGGKYGLMAILSRFTTKTVTVYESRLSRSFSMTNFFMGAESYFPITYKVNILREVFSVASVVWAVVAGALFLTLVLVYVTTMREIRDATPLDGKVYVSKKVLSPAVYGIFRPRIVLPPAMVESEHLKYVLLHERKHIRRLDNLWRVLAFATAAFHWFNPLAWIFLKCFLTDLEIACDESVLQKCGEEEKREYASALVSAAEQRTLFISLFGGAKLRTRIERILSYRKITPVAAAACFTLIAAIAYFLLTNAV